MAEEKKQESSGLTGALPVTIVLALLAGLFIRHSLPYQDERPSARSLPARYSAAQDVDARLWQDPFAAVDGANEETPGPEGAQQTAGSSSHTRDQIYNGDPVAIGDDITVLAVTLPGGPYQEAAEVRMRRRYAVLSALANQGAVPHDEQHIGYFHPDRNSGIGFGLQKKVAFEWWSLPDDKKKVLLLWVDELNLFKYPAAKLKELLCEASPRNPAKVIVSHYAVIGPNTSTLLRDMLKEVEGARKSAAVAECADKPSNNASGPALGEINGLDIVYYSAGATASNKRLLEESIGQTIDGETVSGYLRNQGVTLYRTSATDVAMMGILVDELEIRKVEKTDHVVILSEWDTFYGRAMPDAFKKAWGNGGKDDNGETAVHIYGYMRGLDGILPDKGDKAVNPQAEKKSDNKDKSESDALIEFPEGQNQKDYLRRMADNILELDKDLKDADSPKDVAAIGVLGSDVHDKLMIMEALRQHFPHKLFFTTDLDTAYFHPAKRPYTHNLLVASAFDLKLRNELQDKIPTFRDSYQTAFFLAAQMALKGGTVIAGQKLPRQFEKMLRLHFQHKPVDTTDSDEETYSFPYKRLLRKGKIIISAYSSYGKPLQSEAEGLKTNGIGVSDAKVISCTLLTHNPQLASMPELKLCLELQDNFSSIFNSYLTEFLVPPQMALKDGMGNAVQIDMPSPRLFEIGRSRPVSLPMSQDTVSPIPKDSGRKPKCSLSNWPVCIVELIDELHAHSRQFEIEHSTPVTLLTSGNTVSLKAMNGGKGIKTPSAKYRDDKNKSDCSWTHLFACNTVQPRIFPTSQSQWSLKGLMVVVFVTMIPFMVSWRVRESVYPYCVGVSLFLVFFLMMPVIMPMWNSYLIQPDAEPFYFLEGISVWPSQLLRLSAFLFAMGFFFWGHERIRKMQNVFQAQRGAEIPPTFALPDKPAQLGHCDVLFVGSWQPEQNGKVVASDLWKKYLGYCQQKKMGIPGFLFRVLVQGLAYLAVAGLIIAVNPPNVPARGDFAQVVNLFIIILAIFSTIFLTMWVVENARLCVRLITCLSAKPSQWNGVARDWANRDNKVAPECVPDWLDIQLVARLTKTMQPLIIGPVVCIALLVLGYSPVIDDWDIPWGLSLVLTATLFFAISSEIHLQYGARLTRTKAIDHLTGKISAQRNLNCPDEVVIKRIEAEIERISALREGAFRPWYELPLLQSFGGLGTLVVALQYFYGIWEHGTL